MKLGSFLADVVVAASLCAPAFAHEQQYAAPLLGTSESPPNASPGTGSALVTIDFDLFTMRVQASFSGLTGNVTAAHIHCCEPPPATPASLNFPVATQLPSFTGFPLGVTSGVYDHTFDMVQSSSYNPAFITAHGGSVSTAFNYFVAGLNNGKGYLNIHTSTFGGGEIRALLAPIPEPETYAMLSAGLGLLAFAARRRRA